MIDKTRTAALDPTIGSGTAEHDGKLLADLEAFARLFGHAENCARGCRIGREQLFASVACEEGTRLVLSYLERAPYCYNDADPTANIDPRSTQALRQAVDKFSS